MLLNLRAFSQSDRSKSLLLEGMIHWAEVQNNCNTQFDLVTAYSVLNQKPLGFISAGVGTQVDVGLGFKIYFDLVDYYSYVHNEPNASWEGANGYITVYVDYSLSIGASLPGIGIEFIEFTPGFEDPYINQNLNLASIDLPLVQFNGLQTTIDGSGSENVNLFGVSADGCDSDFKGGVSLITYSNNLARAEIAAEQLISILNDALGPVGNAAMAFDGIDYYDFTKTLKNDLLPLVKEQAFTNCDCYQQVQYSGILSEIKGGEDTNNDGRTDLIFSSANFDGIHVYQEKPLEIEFFNNGNQQNDFIIKIENLTKNGKWRINPLDKNYNAELEYSIYDTYSQTLKNIYPSSSAYLKKYALSPGNEKAYTEGDIFLISLKCDQCQANASENRKIYVKGYRDEDQSLFLNLNNTTMQNDLLSIAWDSEFQAEANLQVAIDPDINTTTPWQKANENDPDNHQWIGDVIQLSQSSKSGSRSFDLSTKPGGRYTLWGILFDDKGSNYFDYMGQISLARNSPPGKPTLTENQYSSLSPSLAFSQYVADDLEADPQKGFQLKVFNSSSELIYNTGFINNSSDNFHTYSLGSYTGYDAASEDVRKSEALSYGSSYTWKVRYLDTGDDWSEWSDLGSFSIPNKGDVFDINIIYPNKTSYSQGQTMAIQWQSALPTGTEYVVDLYKDDLRRAIITTSTTNKAIQWFIPSNQALDNSYNIRVYVKGDTDIFDDSDYFEISEPQANYDISIRQFSTSKSYTKPGNTITFDYQIFNSGNGTASGFTVDYVLRSEATGAIVEESGNYNNSISLVPNETYASGGSIRAPDEEGIYLLEVSLNYSKDSKSGNNSTEYPVYVGNSNPYNVYLNGGSDVWFLEGNHTIHNYSSFNVLAYDDDDARVSLAGKTQTMELDRICLFDADRFALIYKGWFQGYGAVFRYYYQVDDFELDELRFEAQAGKITSIPFSASSGSNIEGVKFLDESDVNDSRRAALETWGFHFDNLSADQNAGEIHFNIPADNPRSYYDFFIEIDRKSAPEYIQRVKVDVIDPKAEFLPALSKQKLTLAPGRNETIEVTAEGSFGFNESIVVSVPEIPNGIQVSFENGVRAFQVGETVTVNVSVNENYDGSFGYLSNISLAFASDTQNKEVPLFVEMVDDSQNFIAIDNVQYIDLDPKKDSLQINFSADFSLGETAVTSNWQYFDGSSWLDIPSDQIKNNAAVPKGSHSIIWVIPSNLRIENARFRMKNKNGTDFLKLISKTESFDSHHDFDAAAVYNGQLYFLDTHSDLSYSRLRIFNLDDYGTLVSSSPYLTQIPQSDAVNMYFCNNRLYFFQDGSSSTSGTLWIYSTSYSYLGSKSFDGQVDCMVCIDNKLHEFFWDNDLDTQTFYELSQSGTRTGNYKVIEYNNSIRSDYSLFDGQNIWIVDGGSFYRIGPNLSLEEKIISGSFDQGALYNNQFLIAVDGTNNVYKYSFYDPYSFFSESQPFHINTTFPPRFIGSNQIDLTEDQDYDTLNLITLFTDQDTDFAGLTFEFIGISSGIMVEYDIAKGNFAIRPKSDVNTDQSFKITVTDGYNSLTQDFNVSVLSIDDNSIAIIEGKTVTINEDKSIKIPFDSLYVDIDSEPLELEFSAFAYQKDNPGYPAGFTPSFNIEDEYLLLEPYKNENGEFVIELEIVNPETDNSLTLSFTLVVLPQNDRPGSFSLTSPVNKRILPGEFGFNWEKATDPEADPVSYKFIISIGGVEYTETLFSNTVIYSIGQDFIGKPGFWQVVATDGSDDTFPVNNYGHFYVVADSSALYPFDQVIKEDISYSIDENISTGTVFGNVLNYFPSDLDELAISIFENDNFNINAEGYLSVNNPLDFESQNEYFLNLSIVYAGYDAINFSSEMVITLNDVNEAPSVDGGAVTIDENSPVGTSTWTVIAFDPEEGDITYSIVSGNDLGAFLIDPTSGKITVADPVQIDFEIHPTFELLVEVSDGEFTNQATITVNLKDQNEAPSIADDKFTIDENSVTNTYVGTIKAVDPDDDELSFSITSGNDTGAFALDPNTGILTIFDSRPVNFEANPVFDLQVVAHDTKMSDTATVVINLNNVNEPPSISDTTFTVMGHSPVGTEIGRILAQDPEGTPVTFSIYPASGTANFAIDQQSGIISVAEAGALDYDFRPSYEFYVGAKDNTQNSWATVSINVLPLPESNEFLQDSLALLAIYNSMGGSNWLTPWDLKRPVNEWSGVTILGNRVTGLDLSAFVMEDGLTYIRDNNVVGALPEELYSLTELIHLSFRANSKVAGSISPAITNLPNVYLLDFTQTSIDGVLPTELLQLKNLGFLSLGHSKISNLESFDFSDLKVLQGLDLGYVSLNTVPAGINLMQEGYVYLEGNKLSALPEFTASHKLSLYVANNQLSFEDLIPVKDLFTDQFQYNRQNIMALNSPAIEVTQGAQVTLKANIDTDVPECIFSWFAPNNSLLATSEDPELSITVSESNIGYYRLEISNEMLPGLTLFGSTKVNLANHFISVSDTTFSVKENSPRGHKIGSLKMSDSYNHNLAFSISSESVINSVSYTPQGDLYISDSAAFDFETNSVITLNTEVTDGFFIEKVAITINVVDEQENEGDDDDSDDDLKSSQTITFIAPDTVFIRSSIELVNLIATSSSGLEVSFRLIEGSGHLTGSQLSVTEAGPVRIMAYQDGNEEFAPAEQVEETINFVEESVSTGVDGKLAESIKIFPNPVTDKLEIVLKDLSSKNLPLVAEIHSISGQRFGKFKISKDKTAIDMSQAPSGMYIITVAKQDGRSLKHQKIWRE